jgi:hypothetical protein
LGNAGDLQDARAAMAAGIEAVVELADSEPFAVLPCELVSPQLDPGLSHQRCLGAA